MYRYQYSDPKLIGSLFVIAGVISLFGAVLFGTLLIAKLNKWSQVEGELLDPRIHAETRSERETGQSQERMVTRYSVFANVVYSFEGKTYKKEIFLESFRADPDSAQRLLEAIRAGKRQNVWLNPRSPEQIDTDLGWNVEAFLMPIIVGVVGTIFAMVGLFINFVVGGQKAAPPPPPPPSDFDRRFGKSLR